MNFSRLLLEKLPNRQWKLGRDLEFNGKYQKFIIKEGFITDLASVPRIFQGIFPKDGSYSEAAVLHDLLWRISQLYYDGLVDFNKEFIKVGSQAYPLSYLVDPVDVDGLFRRAMRISGTNFFARWQMWWAVRLSAILDGRKGAMKLKHWFHLLGIAVFNLSLLALIIYLIYRVI